MYKKTITYTDYDDVQHTEDFYFHLNRAELAEINFNFEGGLQGVLARMQKAKTNKEMMDLIKTFIIFSYGEREGSNFKKFDESGNRLVYSNFLSTEAYSEMVTEMLQSPNGSAISDFVQGALPKDLRSNTEDEKKQSTEPARALPAAENR